MDAQVTGRANGGCTVRVGEFALRAHTGDVGASGDVKIVARPERVTLTAHEAGHHDNALPGIVERTVYVGATIQVIVRLATGATVQSWIANDGEAGSWTHGTPVLARLPPDAIRVLAPAR